MIQWIVHLPLWQIIRSLGIVSYVLLAAGICLGILYSFPVWQGRTKAQLFKLHTFFTVAGTGIGLLHGMVTVIDTYMPFSWSEVLIPFAAKHDPVLTGLGTLAGYGLLVLIFTSDIRHKLKKPLWYAIHLLSYPILAISFIHGYFEGTDTASLGIRWMYVLSMGAVVLLTILRAMMRSEGGGGLAARQAGR
ncbi:ferric reductase-like transmembrane domain-containing protein [Paenibacillus hamazuiensis]|uniref:ferric reductase-like transmembrane domain-containing protein n=1 Tax=Paenibacillus hamazuiensis TaxID=2936508 RepID=UPI00200D82CC|nr:ferric reductase-like transmembrane domain-containing protein [Paenibacillus hamazuiensis]